MRTLIILLLLLTGLSLFAQSDRIRALEKRTHESTGTERIENLIELSGMFYQEGFYKSALELARDAYVEAERENRKDLMSRAMQNEAKATFKTSGLFSAKKAERLLKESIDLLPGDSYKDIRLESLKMLHKHANEKGDIRDANHYAREIAMLEGKPVPALKEETGGLFGGRRRALNQLRERQSEMIQQMDSLQVIAEESELLRDEQRYLNRALAKREVALANLTEAQMRQELLLAQKEKILDSIIFLSVLDSIQLEQQQSQLREQEMEIREKQTQIQLKNSQRNFLLALAGIFVIIGGAIWSRYTNTKKYNSILEEKNKIIQDEKQRSENLLLNILPKAIADELKSSGGALARQYDQVTVLFTDFKDFSRISSELSPQQLVTELDYCFRKFDSIIGKYGLEKIKTIGDSYMCAGGVPGMDPTHPVNVVKAALEIQDFLMNWKLERVGKGLPYFEARLGIHSGPVVAGVVGEKKYAYDIWGDTVNIASRMESNAEPGKVNISEATFKLVKDKFDCEFRGKVPAKNIGEVEMYYVRALKKAV